MNPKILIIGAGPCGLGAAYRLQELGHDNYLVVDKNNYFGGLSASFVDEKGFTWDIGGHVLFSQYHYFNQIINKLLVKEQYEHKRNAQIWIKEQFIPYPFQNNLRYLPKEDLLQCLEGLLCSIVGTPTNYFEWIYTSFGKGIADLFMIPYNEKVWATQLEKMSYEWIGERISSVNFKQILKNVILQLDDTSWGNNYTFKFPKKGGTGQIWYNLGSTIPKINIKFNKTLVRLDTKNKVAHFDDNTIENYDKLITTIPLDQLILMSDVKNKQCAKYLEHTSTHVFGVGIIGKVPEKLQDKCWIYYPENNTPFYRATVFSNYSPNNVPEDHWSLILEVSESKKYPKNHASLGQGVIHGMLNTGLIESSEQITDKWYRFEEYGYPIPTLKRNKGLAVINELEKLDIYSRGRFGAWKYEIGNQDHSFMQGVEAVNKTC